VKIREFFVSLGLDVDEAGFAAAELYAEGVKKSLGLMRDALFAVGRAIGDTILGTAAAGDHIKELAERTGVNAQALQGMAYGAKQSGVEMDSLAQAMAFLARKGVKDVQGEMMRLADQISTMPKDGSRAQLAMEKFGRAGAQMVPFLAKGRAEIARLSAEAEEMGLVLDADALNAADQFSDAMDAMRGSVRGVMYTIGVPLLKALKPVLDGIRAWVSANRKLIAGRIERWVENLATVGGFLWEYVLEPVSRVVGVLVDRFNHLGPILGMVGAAFGIMWLKAMLPAIGIAAAIAAVILVIEDLWTFLEGGDSVIGDLVAVAKAELPKMFDAAWARIKLFYDDTLNIFRMLWFSIKMGVIDAFNGAVISVKGMWRSFVDWIVGTLRAIPDALMTGMAVGARSMLSMVPGGGALSNALFGGGASPTASTRAAAGTGNSVVAPSMSANITVNATGVTDPFAIADAVGARVDESEARMWERAYEAVRGG
jgi:hypothetical protein